MRMSEFTIENAKNYSSTKEFLSIWRKLLSSTQSPEKIYQGPEFFEYLLQTNDGHDQIELIAVKSAASEEIIGILPIRFRNEAFKFGFGSWDFATPSIQVIVLLGTVPLLPSTTGLFEEIVKYLFAKFPTVDAVSMPAFPIEADLYTYINGSTTIKNNYKKHVLHGWRECHSIPLPKNYEQYLQQFSAKKRFNINRQIRLLREYCAGELSIDRIERPEQVSSLISARNSVTSSELLTNLLSEKKFLGLAEQGLLLSYILRSGTRPLAVLLATRSKDVLHLHNILFDPSLMRLSVGASILHLAIEDLTTHFEFTSIDLGYSNPSHNHQSSNVIQTRGHVLLMRKTWRNRLLSFTHNFYVRQLDTFKKIIEHRRKRLKKILPPENTK